MNGKQARRARSAANAEAACQGLWAKGEASVYTKWWRKLAARIFPRLRKRYADWVGRWYRRTLKSWARVAADYARNREAYDLTRRREGKEFLRARESINRKYAQRRIAERATGGR